MRRTEEFKEQRGYFTFVQNSEHDYLEMAYLQALSIKRTQTISSYAIAVDAATRDKITSRHLEVFDYIVDIPWGDAAVEHDWKLANEWKAWWITPFKETVKLDCDIMFTRDISHWWDIMCLKEVFIATRAYDFRGDVATTRAYRKLFDDNNLIDAYSGFTYFRYGRTSADFFQNVKLVFENWPVYRDQVLRNCRHDSARTDEAYAIAAKLTGEELCYIPNTHVGFVHMKGAVNGMDVNDQWTDKLYRQVQGNQLTVGFHRQLYPFHYVNKTVANEILERYDRV